ncbi:hypothetical protein ACS5PU_17185 [Pedobacter sp. GSP4]|uniref:hypothetical protein n=1 Tax=Pedobacter sp. GSP4 TaxID=3453716 RepID=UPI003EEB3111
METTAIRSNDSQELPKPKDPVVELKEWVNETTAMLIVHGIGDQFPISTLDDFARGFVGEFKTVYKDKLSLSHEIMPKKDGNETWFDNVLRIKHADSENYIDIYEYYWANYTEDKSSWNDLNKWLQGVVKGAKHFYNKNKSLGEEYKDKSIFFDQNGNFIAWRYQIFLSLFAKIFMAFDIAVGGLLKLLTFLPIPFLGKLVSSWTESYVESSMHSLTNVAGDIAIYNVVDPKSKFYAIKKQIASGAVSALKYLIEKPKVIGQTDGDIPQNYYPKVIVAGHSLGSQIAYDAINKLNLLVNQGEIKNYTANATLLSNPNKKLADQLSGFITFGSPLDKIIFFLRENVADQQYIKQQMIHHYQGFKMRDLDPFKDRILAYVETTCKLERFLEEIKWRNYYDGRDYVSGGLDYYTNLTNVNCRFASGTFSFTHSNYWNYSHFYRDIINEFL